MLIQSFQGFTVSLYEYAATVPTLWETTKGLFPLFFLCFCSETDPTPAFIKENPQYLAKDNAMAFLSPDGGDTYNRCHCMSPVVVSRAC